VRGNGAVLGTATLDHKIRKYQFTGGVDRVEITGTLVSVFELCFIPGWVCIQFDAQSFPKGSTGSVSYAGMALVSDGSMSVDSGTLEVDPPPPRLPTPLTDRSAASGSLVQQLATPFAAATAPMRAAYAGSAPAQKAHMAVIAVNGLVESALVELPTLGTVQLVPGVAPIASRPSRATVGNVVPASRTLSVHTMVVDAARIWVQGNKARTATLTVVFSKPTTRVRVTLAGSATVMAFAGSQQIASGTSASGGVVTLDANPMAPAHTGWLDRVVIIAASQVRVAKVCIDASDFGWARYEQWKWSQGVLRSVESLYETDPVLPPGDYVLRVHTAAVETGARTDERPETVDAAFKVGAPPGFPVAATTSARPTYPNGGPLTDLSTYVAKTMPASGASLWYRGYDTAVAFNENYVTRLYLDAGYEMRVSVINASGVAIRSATREIWGRTKASLDAWTTEYVRTLNGDGSDPCAQVDVSKIVRPEMVTAGSGEPLDASSLHASQLRTTTSPPTMLHHFEFVTSAYVSLRHHLNMFNGRCRRLDADPSAHGAATPPSVLADGALGRQTATASAVATARASQTKADTGTATSADIDQADADLQTLIQVRADAQTRAAAAFNDVWQACFGDQTPGLLPTSLRVSVVTAQAQTPVAVLLVESPEPIAWSRIQTVAATVSTPPMRKTAITIAADFGRPDAGMDVQYAGVSWHAGVELWVNNGVLRARADEPLDVTLTLDTITALELDLIVDNGGQATVTTTPALANGSIVVGPSSTPTTISAAAPSGEVFTSVRITGLGVGVSGCRLTGPFVPIPPAGTLRMTDVRLPTSAAPLDHEITLLATDGGTFDGYTIRWSDAVAPGQSQLYAVLGSVTLAPGQRIRLVPGRASAPVTDEALVQAGGAGTAPPPTGAVYQLIDSSGVIIHERAAMPLGSSTDAAIAAMPNADGSRAFLIPPPTGQAIGAGYWEIGFEQAGDAGPDLDVWSVGGVPLTEKARLTFVIV
jgi:hypothetical protein